MKSQIDKRKWNKAYTALERESMNDTNEEKQERADKALAALLDGTITINEFNFWVKEEEDARENNYRGA